MLAGGTRTGCLTSGDHPAGCNKGFDVFEMCTARINPGTKSLRRGNGGIRSHLLSKVQSIRFVRQDTEKLLLGVCGGHAAFSDGDWGGDSARKGGFDEWKS
jgi:hypothetical protein